jgi:hypothetical protein
MPEDLAFIAGEALAIALSSACGVGAGTFPVGRNWRKVMAKA